jgi:hypothetical protein
MAKRIYAARWRNNIRPFGRSLSARRKVNFSHSSDTAQVGDRLRQQMLESQAGACIPFGLRIGSSASATSSTEHSQHVQPTFGQSERALTREAEGATYRRGRAPGGWQELSWKRALIFPHILKCAMRMSVELEIAKAGPALGAQGYFQYWARIINVIVVTTICTNPQ